MLCRVRQGRVAAKRCCPGARHKEHKYGCQAEHQAQQHQPAALTDAQSCCKTCSVVKTPHCLAGHCCIINPCPWSCGATAPASPRRIESPVGASNHSRGSGPRVVPEVSSAQEVAPYHQGVLGSVYRMGPASWQDQGVPLAQPYPDAARCPVAQKGAGLHGLICQRYFRD